jgi:hypothetical protein
MDSATFFVAYPPHSPWAWGWDAWVAIGTLTRALVTVVAILLPLMIERRRARLRAVQYAAMIDLELFVLSKMLLNLAEDTKADMRTVANIKNAAHSMKISHGRVATPILDRLAQAIDLFPPELILPLTKILGAISVRARNPPFEDMENWPYEPLARCIRATFVETVSMLIDTLDARAKLGKILNRHFNVNEPHVIPDEIRAEFEVERKK